jgi:tetratricopeptide (TPR) repeat protein
VKVMQRRATIAVALSLGMAGAPALNAQVRGVAPGPDTPRLLVAVFASNDRMLGVQVADAIRQRITTASNPRQLYVIPKEQIVNFLESSGYRPDSSLGPADLKELAKQLRADDIVFGDATRGPAGIKVEPRLLVASDPRYSQPLPELSVSSPNDAGRQIERSLGDARKQLVDFRACQNHIRGRALDKAIASAQAGIAKYTNSTIARLCLVNAQIELKANPDSMLRVTDEILKIDPENSMALGFAFVAFQTKGDNASAIRTLMRMQQLDPGNPTLREQVVTELAKLGQPDTALVIVDAMLTANPGDPQLVRQKWLLSLSAAANKDTAGGVRAAAFARALAAGEEMVRGDSATADSTYYARQIAAAVVANNPTKSTQLAAAATRKFPRSVTFWTDRANAERAAARQDSTRKAQYLSAADESMRQAMALDPKTPNGNVFRATVNLEMGRVDTAVAIARRGVAAGEDRRQWGTFLLGPTRDAVTKAQKSDSLEHWEQALALAQEADGLAPQPTSKFFLGVASFQIGINALQTVSELQKAKRPDNPRMCALGKRINDMWLITQVNMPAGGSIDAGTARQVLGFVAQYGPNAEQIVKQTCK